MRASPAMAWCFCQSGNPPNSLYVRRTRSPLKFGPRPGGVPARSFSVSRLCDSYSEVILRLVEAKARGSPS